ncbi:hypothetical protein ASZ78_012751 [Callipepla squamata]|uniref:Uncharacterized protein n=1 Tax=Callipepla squamata TaxID=9009 RepID=A0A226MI65_CALSU|nr:hypothetical protein ASZ78_012751 [Callipepla squamata]
MEERESLQWISDRAFLYGSGAGDSTDGPVIMAHVTTYMGCTIPHLLRSASRLCPAHSALVALRHSASCYCTVNG